VEEEDSETEREGLRDTEELGVGLILALGVADWLREIDKLGDRDTEELGVIDGESDGLRDGDKDKLRDGDKDGDSEGDRDVLETSSGSNG
jgi:hypothetical protein